MVTENDARTDHYGPSTLQWLRVSVAIENAVRGGCPELFSYPYDDFPTLIVGNVLDAIDKAGYCIVSRNALTALSSHDATGTEENDRLRDLLVEARAEVDRWGYGDFHYGPTPRDEGVLAMLAKIDAELAHTAQHRDQP